MKSQRLKSYLEVQLLCVVICLVLGIVMLPAILFLVPSSSEVSLSNGINNTNKTCLEPLSLSPESNGECFLALANTLIDSYCQERDVFVIRNKDSTAKSLIGGLDLLGASAECREEVVPFLCLHLFGLCSGSGVLIQPTSTQCQQIRDMACHNEWMVALSLDIDLPDCDMFPSESPSCDGTGRNNTNDNNTNIQLPNLKASGEILDCRQDFFRETNSSDCIPNCFTWNQFGRMASIAVDVVTIIVAAIGFFSSIAVIIVSIVRHKSMLTFPSILVIYLAGMDMLPLTFLFLVNYMDRGNLFCSSTNLLKAWIEVTPFCVISGISFSYILMQGSLWSLFYISTVLWAVRFPFKYREFMQTGNIKYLHFSCLIVGLCLPLLSVIASMANFAVDIKTDPILGNVTFLSGGLGYRPSQFPPIICTVGHPDTTFYSLILPLQISLGLTGTALVLTFYFIYKQSHKDGKKLSVAEKKIIIAFLCFIIVATTVTTSLAIQARDGIVGFIALLNYFTCEQRGYDYENPCSRQEFEQYDHPVLFGLGTVGLGIFPALLLIFTVNIKELKKKKFKAWLSLSIIKRLASNINE